MNGATESGQFNTGLTISRSHILPLTHLVSILLLFAGIAQSVERQLPKLKVAGSIPVSRSAGG